MRKFHIATLAVAGLVLGGCYRVTVTTDAPAAPATAAYPWRHFFVAGLVPPDTLHANCPAGVQQVVTEASFLNGLVSGITYNLYTPRSTKITCVAK